MLDFVSLKSDAKKAEQQIHTMGLPASSSPSDGEKKIKCVVRDLDNTVWSGTLIEDGLENLRMNMKAVEAIVELDRRGILNSVATKNHPEGTLAALKHFGLDNYFLCPQIGWEPKSTLIKTIQQTLNIGLNMFAFVDEQPFERGEVVQQYPDVQLFDPKGHVLV